MRPTCGPARGRPPSLTLIEITGGGRCCAFAAWQRDWLLGCNPAESRTVLPRNLPNDAEAAATPECETCRCVTLPPLDFGCAHGFADAGT